jgi:putative transposase
VIGDDGAIEIAVRRDRTAVSSRRSSPRGRPGSTVLMTGSSAAMPAVCRFARSAHRPELYGVEVSPELISRVTDAVLEEVREWQNRPLDPVYPVIFFDALRVKIRDAGLVRNKAVDVALALNSDGEKAVLGLWIEQAEGAKFWLKVMNEIKTRGVNDVQIAVVDGSRACPRDSGGICRGDRHGIPTDHGADPGSGSGAGSVSST